MQQIRVVREQMIGTIRLGRSVPLQGRFRLQEKTHHHVDVIFDRHTHLLSES